MQAAFDIVAEVGFEGLRTRAVAERAGVNVATLHYYFPTKEALIASLGELLAAKFVTLHAPRLPSSGRAGVDLLRQEFADSKFYLQHHPELMSVMQELALRANRDPAAQRLLHGMSAHWRVNVERIVRECIADGTFGPDTEVSETAALLQAIHAGLASTGPDSVDEVCRAVEKLLVAPLPEGKK